MSRSRALDPVRPAAVLILALCLSGVAVDAAVLRAATRTGSGAPGVPGVPGVPSVPGGPSVPLRLTHAECVAVARWFSRWYAEQQFAAATGLSWVRSRAWTPTPTPRAAPPRSISWGTPAHPGLAALPQLTHLPPPDRA